MNSIDQSPTTRPDQAIFVAYEDHVDKNPAEPERNLMRALLRGALEDIRKTGDAREEARRYILANNDRFIFSFLNVCQHLNLCPQTVRTVLGLTGELTSGELSDQQQVLADSIPSKKKIRKSAIIP